MTHQTPSEIIDAMHGFSEALLAANKALADLPYGKRAVLDHYLDQPIYFGDLSDAARMISAMADDWTDELPGEGEVAARELRKAGV